MSDFTSLDILSNTFEITNLTNLAGYSLVMDPNDQSVQYNYDVLTIDSGENFILITSNDSINVKISLQGLEEESNITFSAPPKLVFTYLQAITIFITKISLHILDIFF